MKKTLFLFSLSILTVFTVFFVTPVLAADIDSCVPKSIVIVSDESNNLIGGGSAVETYDESPVWTTIPGAKWIWKSVQVEYPNTQEVITVTNTFNVIGNPSTTTLSIAADDYFKVSLNGNVVASNATDLNFLSVQSYNLDSYVVSGQNNLEIELTNAPFYNPIAPGTGGTFQNNPAGVIYSLTSESLDCPAQPENDTNFSGKSGQKKLKPFSANTNGEVLGAFTEIPASVFFPKFVEAITPAQNVDQSLVMGTSTVQESVASLSDNKEQSNTETIVSFLNSFPEDLWCVLVAFLIVLILYIVWLFMIHNREDRINEFSQKTGLRMIDFLFFLISGLITTLILFLVAFTCSLIWLWILLAVICVGIHFRVI